MNRTGGSPQPLRDSMNTLQMRKCVNTNYFAPKLVNGSPAGYLEYRGQQKLSDVMAQIDAVLEGIVNAEGDNARQLYEWWGAPNNTEDVEFPKGEPFAAFRYGSSEGYFVQILSSQRSTGSYVLCAEIKYLTDKTFVYRVAQELNEALWEGGFSTCPPPSDTDIS